MPRDLMAEVQAAILAACREMDARARERRLSGPAALLIHYQNGNPKGVQMVAFDAGAVVPVKTP